MTKQRIALISLVALLAFGLLWGGQLLYQKNWVGVSLKQQSQDIPGVELARVERVNGKETLIVTTRNMADLRTASQALRTMAKGKPVQILDSRNVKLEQVFGGMQFALQEGIIRGNFTEMAQNLNVQAQKEGVQLYLTMDDEAIYLTLSQGDAQLVEVLERAGQGQFIPGKRE